MKYEKAKTKNQAYSAWPFLNLLKRSETLSFRLSVDWNPVLRCAYLIRCLTPKP